MVTESASQLRSRIGTSSNPPERTVRAELGNFAGRFLADVDRNGNHTHKRAGNN